MKFPFIIMPEMSERQLWRYRNHIDSDASGWHRRWTESIWRRHQHPSNARLSGWNSPEDQKRRLIHFYDEYGVEGRSFVLRNTYLWMSVSLPEEDIIEYETVIREGLREGEWRAEGAEAEMTDIYRACAVAESTPFYEVIDDLVKRDLIVGPVITNNFDCLCADRGLQEVSLRRYDWGPYYPQIEYDPRARSLLVVGVHADRRLVQMRARDRGLKVVFVDPERYVGPDGRIIEYPVEAPQNQDFFVRATAEEALPRLHQYLLKSNGAN